MLLHQNKAQICFESFEVSKWRLFKNASEFQDVSVREFQFDENRKAGGAAYDCLYHVKSIFTTNKTKNMIRYKEKRK